MKEQKNTTTDSISQQCPCSSINQGQTVCKEFPYDILIFICKPIIIIIKLANTNLFGWKKLFRVTLVCVKPTNKPNYTC